MKLTRSSVLSAAGIALVIGLFAWAWITTDRHHSNQTHMGYGIEQMHDQMQNVPMPMSAMRMFDMDMASMRESLDDGSSMMQMPMTPVHLRHMRSMGMGSMGMGSVDDRDADHKQHHLEGR